MVRELASAFQQAVVEVMVRKLLAMAERHHARGLVLGGGVAANALLRQEVARCSPLPVIIPPAVLCTDNGAMVAACGAFQFQRGLQHGLDLDVDPSLALG
jgi:N6-L-threonylcarbamoyladenine synthase